MATTIEPDIQLKPEDRVHLVHMSATHGYAVLHRLMRSEVDKFVVDLINSDPSKPEDVVAKQVLAKAAAQFFQGVTNRINEEIQAYTNAPRPTDRPVDTTAGVLDLDNLTEEIKDAPSLLGGEAE